MGSSQEEMIFSDEEDRFKDNEIHVRKQNRRGRKWVTTIENIPESFDLNKLLNSLKKELCCNGTIVTSEKTGKRILQMQGDQGAKIQTMLEEVFPVYKVNFFGQ